MAQITGVIKDKETGQVTLLLDNGESLVVDQEEAQNKNLVEGSTLTEDQLDSIEQSEELLKAYTRAINFISYRPRSIKEVRQNLEQKTDLDNQSIQLVLERLKLRKWLSDEEFATWWVNSRLTHRPRGRFVLEQELVQKGVDREIASQVLNKLVTGEAQSESVQKLLSNRLKLWGHLDKKDLRTKLINFLLRKGFDYSQVCALVDEQLNSGVK